MSDADLGRTLAGPVTVEVPPIAGSRFTGHAAPATDEAAALAVVAARRAADPDAAHHCWAWVLADGRQRADDDGEPRDTAGAPVLRHLEGAGLVNVVVVVTRWFGGTKLGRGGLVRAYGGAAAAALDAAAVVERHRTVRRRIEHAYQQTAAIEGVLAAFDTHEVASDYGAAVTRTVAVRAARAAAFDAAVRDATSGEVTPAATEEE